MRYFEEWSAKGWIIIPQKGNRTFSFLSCYIFFNVLRWWVRCWQAFILDLSLSPFYGPLTLLLEAFIVGYLILVYFVSTTNLWTEHCFNCTNVQVQKRQTTHVFLHSRQIWTMFINIYKIKIFFQNISCFILYVLARAAVLGRHLGKFLALGCGGQHLKINYFPSSSSTSSSSLSS